jgi:nucleoside 2-deoxyribosyltransferase
MDHADCCVLVLPSGRSAHLEAGYMAAQGKPVYTLALERVEPDLMNLLLGPPDHIATTMDELFDLLGVPNR